MYRIIVVGFTFVSDKASIVSFIVDGYPGKTNVTKDEYDRLTLRCIVDSNPLAAIELKHNKSVIQRKTDVQKLDYVKIRLSCDDFGLYTCSGQNAYNKMSVPIMHIDVYVRCKSKQVA